MKYYIFTFIFLAIGCASRNKTVIAHRGASGYLPEHTLAGAAMAHSWGVDYIEPDLVLTKDDNIVILHDHHIDTTTNVAEVYPSKKRKDGRYYAIDFTLAEIKKLKVHERRNLKTKKPVFSKRFPENKSTFRVPTLAEFIELVQGLNKSRNMNVGIYPELKQPEFHQKEGKDIAAIVLKELDKYGYNKADAKIFVQCFYPPTLKRLRKELGAKMPLVALIAENSWKESSIDYDYYQSEKGIQELAEYVNGIGPYFYQLVKSPDGVNFAESKLVSYAHKYNLKVHPYTHRSDSLGKNFSDDEAFFNFIYDRAKVDGIFSDFGDVAMKYSK